MNTTLERLASEIAAIIGDRNLRRDDAVRLTDPGAYPANTGAELMVSPATTDEVAAIIRASAAAGVSVVTQGGRTGLVGGGAATPDQVILSLGRMNRIEKLDPVAGTAIVEAGVTLQALQDAARDHGLGPGIDLPSRGTATIGGMISTNAGGLEAHRHGVMRHRVLGLEVVLPDGQVMRDLSQILKVSAGYDLKHLFIGAEGTLGVVTRAVIRLTPLAPSGVVIMLSVPDGDAMLDTMQRARQTGRLRASEAMWKPYFDFSAAHQKWSAPDYDTDAPIHFILDFEGDAAEDAAADVFEAVMERYPTATGVMAANLAQADAIWWLREDTQSFSRAFPNLPSFDVSLPISDLPAYAARIEGELRALGYEPLIFGHVGDGNLHVMIGTPGADIPAADMVQIEHILMSGLMAQGGSFSAEHGVGSKRRHLLQAEADPVKLALMRQVKALIDPANLMNPGKVVDPA